MCLICLKQLIYVTNTTDKHRCQTCTAIKILQVQNYDFFHFILWSIHFAPVNSRLFFVQYFFPDTIQKRISVRNHARMLARESIKVASTLLVVPAFFGLKNCNVASFRMLQHATVSALRVISPLSSVTRERALKLRRLDIVEGFFVSESHLMTRI